MKRIPLVGKILAGFVLGTGVGLALSECCDPSTTNRILPWIAPFGDVLVAMLKMVVYPIILFSLVGGAASLSLRDSGRIGGRVLAWYFATSLFATVFGVFMAMLMDPTLPAVDAKTMAAGQKALAANGTGGASFGDFLRHALLDLQPARERIDDAGELGYAQHLALRDVPDRALAVERQHVVLAHRVELDVLQNHHVVRAGREVRAVHNGLHLLAVALRQERERLRDPHGGLLQSLALRILPELDQQFPDKLRNPLLIWFSRFQDFRP